jgi:hypothetical protein
MISGISSGRKEVELVRFSLSDKVELSKKFKRLKDLEGELFSWETGWTSLV